MDGVYDEEGLSDGVGDGLYSDLELGDGDAKGDASRSSGAADGSMVPSSSSSESGGLVLFGVHLVALHQRKLFKKERQTFDPSQTFSLHLKFPVQHFSSRPPFFFVSHFLKKRNRDAVDTAPLGSMEKASVAPNVGDPYAVPAQTEAIATAVTIYIRAPIFRDNVQQTVAVVLI